ncbi:restriction endonuclease subunit S [Gaoshiqia sediminis]|uniref:Restriction endonuclease subunit S n=1 Tax=Gaoshiqia sediminis TaxID=2986998 RepID=A0AA42C8C9_9BACT|nr:restriction endonuclease subunit S [Gaoshiqia sediminis]MCW0484564.1 restriction endonuclease subunit S [Gaoshiqia sediminis]
MSKLQPYDNYQPVQYDYISQLPHDWKLLPNMAIFRERIERGHENEELLSVTIGRGIIKQSELEKKDSSTLDKSKYLLVYPGDLVYSMRFRQGASGYSIHKGIVSPACTVLKPKREIEINPRFFFFMFRTGFYKNYVERFAYGIADGQIPLRYVDFKRMYTIVPPLETQNAIVAYLDRKTKQIQDFIAKKQRLIELLEEQKKSITFNLLTKGIDNVNSEPVKDSWLQEKPVHWKVHRGKSMFKIFGGFAPSDLRILNESEYSQLNAISYYKVDDLNNVDGFLLKPSSWRVNSKKLRTTGKGTILLPKRGAAIMTNKVTQCSDSCVFDSNIMGIKVDNSIVHTDYICLWLKTRNLIELADVTTIPQLNNKHIYPLLISLPDLEEQKRILEYLQEKTNHLGRSVSIAMSEIEKAKEYQESLITQVVTGQLKVPMSELRLEGLLDDRIGINTY